MFLYCEVCKLITYHGLYTTVYTGEATETLSECRSCGSQYLFTYQQFQEILKNQKK